MDPVKKVKSIRYKLILRFTFLFVILFAVVQVIVFVNFRNSNIEASKDKAHTVAEVVRDTITSFMVLGVIGKREIFIDNIKATAGLKHVRVLRGLPVINQFGTPRADEYPETNLEKQVLSTGIEGIRLQENLDKVEIHLVIPYRASSKGKIVCMNCHNVNEGEVLGAVSIVMDLTEKRMESVYTIVYMSIASFGFFIGTLYMILRFFRPYMDFFNTIRQKFSRIQDGYFGESVTLKSNDEAGAVAASLNIMMDRLSSTLGEIRDKVALLIGSPFGQTGNDLKDTAIMVDELVKLYNFKRTIENDSTKIEIYARLEKILADRKISRFAIFEVHPASNRINPISTAFPPESNFDPESLVQWCNPEILEDAELCRAKHTGLTVDSSGKHNHCSKFIAPSDNGHYIHYCVPFFVSGQVGGIVQFIGEMSDAETIQTAIRYTKSYLQEAAPVIEAKTFMQLLREQSMRDQLTGLYNRRFFEEFIQSGRVINKDIERIGVLMIDIDFFKQVNDNFGHDAGDAVLTTLSEALKGSLRETDILVRYGGEEILALLIDLHPNTIMIIADKLRRKVESMEIPVSGGKLMRTISIGVAEYPDDNRSVRECVSFADKALYQAKQTGRNRIVRFDPNTIL